MSELTHIIGREIASRGVISFARFMELALYFPRLGYYERQSKQIGCQGDFYTSVAVGSLFGELLAFQLTRWLAEFPLCETAAAAWRGRHKVASPGRGEAPTRTLQILEAGAHDGQLAFDVLTWIERYEPAWLAKLEYWILEPSTERQHRQKEKLAQFALSVRWFGSWEALAAREIHGVIFSNELLDSFPVHRIAWDARALRWFEWGVGWAAGQFVWKRMPLKTSKSGSDDDSISLPQLPNELLAVLPDGFITENSPAAEQWWEKAARALSRGKLMMLDYGLSAGDFFAPERANGTLRAYAGHHCSGDLLAHPGDQDLTSHVNITALQRAGEGAGLVTEGVITQAQFLTRTLERSTAQKAEFILSDTERCRQFQTLTHPEHLGRPFKVLVQSRP